MFHQFLAWKSLETPMFFFNRWYSQLTSWLSNFNRKAVLQREAKTSTLPPIEAKFDVSRISIALLEFNCFPTVSIDVPSNWNKKTNPKTWYDYELPCRYQLGLRTNGKQKRSGRHRKSGTLVTWRFRSQKEDRETPVCGGDERVYGMDASLNKAITKLPNGPMIWRVQTKVPVEVVLFSIFVRYYRVRLKPFCRLANRHRDTHSAGILLNGHFNQTSDETTQGMTFAQTWGEEWKAPKEWKGEKEWKGASNDWSGGSTDAWVASDLIYFHIYFASDTVFHKLPPGIMAVNSSVPSEDFSFLYNFWSCSTCMTNESKAM